MKNRFLFILTAFCTLAFFAAPADILATAEEESRLALVASTPEEGAPHLERAIAEYESLRSAGIENGALYGRLGALYLRKGDLGQAILNLKKGLVFAPRNDALKSNLALARKQRADHFPEETPSGVLRTLAFFHYDLPYPLRVNLALAAWFLFACISAVMLWKRSPALISCAVFLLVFVLLFGTSAAYTAYHLKNRRFAVISQAECMPRKGDNDAYAPAIHSALHAGTEVTILRTRGEWSYVQLPGKLTGWLKNDNLAN